MPGDTPTLHGNWSYPTAIRFGAGRVHELSDACRELGIRKPLLVTDPTLAELPMLRDVLAVNERAGLPTTVWKGVKGNPTGDNVNQGVGVYRAGGHDGVIAFGGGSALDAGKAIALMVGQSRPIWDFEDVEDWYTRVNEEGMARVVAVPTTSGTGSEVGRASVIVDESARRKKVIFHPRMLPERVICDPSLTVGMPRELTAAVGMDALGHNLEAYLSPSFHPQAEGIALEGLRLCRVALERACDDGHDATARAQMMAASLMGATAFQKGLGAAHAVAHAVGGRFDLHHGTVIGVMLPYVVQLNRSVTHDKLERLTAYLELPGNGPEGFLEWILELRASLGIPENLAALGISSDDVAALAPLAVSDPTAASNPVALDRACAENLLERAVRGRLD